jgi:hypothetical protein
MSKKKKEIVSFDYESYSKSLEKTLDGATKDYYSSLHDVNNHQVSIAKTYLWVSVALLGVYSALYNSIIDHSKIDIHFLVLGLFSYLSACTGFGVCLYSIPSRKGYCRIPQVNWEHLSLDAYSRLEEKTPNAYCDFLCQMIKLTNSAYEHNFKTNLKRAKLLRATSWILIFSFCCALISGIVFFYISN